MKEIVFLPIEQLFQHPDNPRKELGDLTELADSIRQNGVFQNLTVIPGRYMTAEEWGEIAREYKENPAEELREQMNNHLCMDGYTVIIGHRRLVAAKLAGLTELPCVIVEMSKKEQLQTMLVENMQRSDLTVYEQAQGFRQLSFLGCSVNEISEKSGFSKTTVRSRLKIAELDPATLKEVSGRQLSLADFDHLAEVEDIKVRNEVLKSIGTSNFGQELEKAKVTQTVAKKMPELKAWLKEHGAQQIERNQAWGNGYANFYGKGGKYYGHIYIDKLGEQGNTLPTEEEINGQNLFYDIDDRSIGFYVATSRAPKESKSRDQLDRERLAREVKKQIKSLSDIHYQLRKGFIERLTVTKRNREDVLMGGVIIGLYYLHGHSTVHSDGVSAVLGLDKYEYHEKKIFEGIGKLTDGAHDKELAGAIYAMYRDSAENWFADNMLVAGIIPSYSDRYCNASLKLLYNWLISLGYEMSEDEMQMMDGSHELYHRGEGK